MKNILLLTCLLVVPSIGTILLNAVNKKQVASTRFAARLGLALVLFTTGIGHFVQTEGMRMLLPVWIPSAREVILVTGVFETAAAVGLLFAVTSRITARVLVCFFIAVFPANLTS